MVWTPTPLPLLIAPRRVGNQQREKAYTVQVTVDRLPGLGYQLAFALSAMYHVSLSSSPTPVLSVCKVPRGISAIDMQLLFWKIFGLLSRRYTDDVRTAPHRRPLYPTRSGFHHRISVVPRSCCRSPKLCYLPRCARYLPG